MRATKIDKFIKIGRFCPRFMVQYCRGDEYDNQYKSNINDDWGESKFL